MTERMVSIANLVGTQVRRALALDLVEQYASDMRAGAVFPPVTVYQCGDVLYLADGWHRKEATSKCGATEISAVVTNGTEDDAIWFAIGANKTHGQRLTTEDKAHAIRLAVQRWPERSSRQIADQVGCDNSYVKKVKDQVLTSQHLPARVTGRDGKSYPATRKATMTAAAPAVEKVEYKTTVDGQRRPVLDKTQAGSAARRDRVRELADSGANVDQIAAAVGLEVATIENIVYRHKIPVRAREVMGKTRKHDPNRIVSQMVMDAENLTADVGLIDWDALDLSLLAQWLESLRESQRHLAAFVKALASLGGRQNATSHSNAPSFEDSARADF